ncbi:dynein heavy chain, partial [Kipferlia bialata]
VLAARQTKTEARGILEVARVLGQDDMVHALRAHVEKVVAVAKRQESVAIKHWGRTAVMPSEGVTLLRMRPEDGLLEVGLGDDAIKLLRDVRVLSALGYSKSGRVLNQQMRDMANRVSEMMRHILALQRVSAFYNTLAPRLHPAHKPALLEPAKRFESVIRRVSTVAEGISIFSSSAQVISGVKDITAELQSAMLKLEKKITSLEKLHDQFRDVLSRLLTIPIHTTEGVEIWARGIKSLRNETAALASGKHKDMRGIKVDISAWVTHWDTAIARCLSVVYANGVLDVVVQTKLDNPVVCVIEEPDAEGEGRVYLDPSPHAVRQTLTQRLNEYLTLFDRHPELRGISHKGTALATLQQCALDRLPQALSLIGSVVSNLSCLEAELVRRLALTMVQGSQAGPERDTPAVSEAESEGEASAPGISVPLPGMSPSAVSDNLRKVETLRGQAHDVILASLPFLKPSSGTEHTLSPSSLIVDMGQAFRALSRQGDVLLTLCGESILDRVTHLGNRVHQFVSEAVSTLSADVSSVGDLAALADAQRKVELSLKNPARGGISSLMGEIADFQPVLQKLKDLGTDGNILKTLTQVIKAADTSAGSLKQMLMDSDQKLEQRKQGLKDALVRRLGGDSASPEGCLKRGRAAVDGYAAAVEGLIGDVESNGLGAVVIDEGSFKQYIAEIASVATDIAAVEQEAQSLFNVGVSKLVPKTHGELEQIGPMGEVAERDGALLSLVCEYQTAHKAMAECEWEEMRTRPQELKVFHSEWQGKLAAFEREKEAGEGSQSRLSGVLLSAVSTDLSSLSKVLPALSALRCEALTAVHWREIGSMVGTTLTGRIETGALLKCSQALVAALPRLRQLVRRAEGELAVRAALDDVSRWARVRATLQPVPLSLSEGSESRVKGGRERVLVQGMGRVLKDLSEKQTLLAALKDSPFYASVKAEAERWGATLTHLSGALLSLTSVQQRVTSLEPVIARGALVESEDAFYAALTVVLSILDEFISRANTSKPAVELLSVTLSAGSLPSSFTSSLSLSQGVASPTDVVRALERVEAVLLETQKALKQYLEGKRLAFPRFFFVGDADLLAILAGATADPIGVLSPHLRKLYQGVSTLSLAPGDGPPCIASFGSVEGETVQMVRAVAVKGEPEQWMAEMDGVISVSLQASLATALGVQKETGHGEFATVHDTLSLDRALASDLDLSLPGETLCLAQSVLYTAQVDAAMAEKGEERANALALVSDSVHSQLDRVAELLTSPQLTGAILPRSPLAVMRLKLKSLATVLSHQIDVVASLTGCGQDAAETEGEGTAADWVWFRELKHRATYGLDVTVSCLDGEIPFTWEYQGNPVRLVHTPLTTVCYTSLMAGLALGKGGNPFGPAGSGKTESVKALGLILGRPTIVVNCDGAIDVESMSRLLIGLVLTGAFGCFDEFNRLSESVLSAVSQHIQTIQTAVLHAQQTNTTKTCISIDGTTVRKITPGAAVFVTMNPVSREYRGRSELPQNLKDLVRPVHMARPDTSLIAAVYLAGDGFRHAKELAVNCAHFASLAACRITTSKHLDWGLRSLQAVLRSAGLWRREAVKGLEGQALKERESAIVVRALRSGTVSRVTPSERVVFEEIVKDVFGEAASQMPPTPHTEVLLREALQAECESLGLEVRESQVSLCVQLHSALSSKMGVVLLGDPGCGKSTILRLFKGAVLRLSKGALAVSDAVLAPRSMARASLLGYVDQDSRDWTDGVLTRAARDAAAVTAADGVTGAQWRWVVCDGDVDPDWIEALNSVLDDNRLLTLASGERIRFPLPSDPLQGFMAKASDTEEDGASPKSGEKEASSAEGVVAPVSFLFETCSLAHASPATVSRLAIILVAKGEDTQDPAAQERQRESEREAELKREDAKEIASREIGRIGSVVNVRLPGSP